ncbi:vesicle coat protein [Triangularia verruculosa]|uniref:Vesicle coat protein n=1 Tax=Triangularia verruculosa TaxID=2587418 RepID=A0AAN6X6K1_9PEZI|nr:vesicle coat protein [Triangularia verruculosa]
MLIPHLQLCLAHYCDLHGPTPLMVTEGLPVPCNVCYDDELHNRPGSGPDRPRSSVPTPGESTQATTAITEALRRMDFAGAQRSSSVPATEQEAQIHRAALRRAAQAAAPSSALSGSAIETPPQSPQLPPGGAPGAKQQSQQSKPRQDSSFRKTYDDYVTRRAGPCDNCALTLPKLQPGSGGVGVDPRPERGPTLRSKAPCARVYNQTSPPTSQSSSSTASEDESADQRQPAHRRTPTAASVTSRSSESSSVSNMNSHTHYLEYISTHEPLAPSSFSIVRASCLRTLSLETLPRAPQTSPTNPSAMSTPCASPSTPAFVTTHSVGNAVSGGPIFFGDPAAGYTTAYIFRIPDMHARGHKRVYAFLALSTHRERLAMKTFGYVAAAFRDMATWIQALAEAEAERSLADSNASSPILPGPGYGSFLSEPPPQTTTTTTPAVNSNSSFLTGGMGGLSRRMGSGFAGAGGGVALKQRGLAELVGMPDFFLELHTKFVKLLLELGVAMGT